MLRAGMILGERYEILEQIGSGGMSEVYKAKCHKLNRCVAIKVLKEEFSGDINFVKRFRVEAQSAASLTHPNIVNVYDVGDEGDLHYIVMELVEGITLKNYIAKKGRLDVKESIGIALQVAQGIGAAHQQHIIHRDIKPQNMIISRDGKVKVTDFGIAKAVTTQTINSNAVGSVHYISPEQARGGYCDERSDIYSLGITMYEMVTGRVPYEGDNTVSIALAHLHDEMVSPSFYCDEIPLALEKIILKCTEKKPERRYNSIQELIADLRRALITPDEDFVRLAPADNNGQTIMIGSEQLRQINHDGPRTSGSNSTNVQRQAPSKPQTDRELKMEFASAESRHPDRKRKAEQDIDDDEIGEEGSPKVEKIFTIAGVAVAVLLVIVLLFVLYKALFNSDKKDINPTATTESQMSDSQTLMPKVVGEHIDEVEKLLKDATLDPVISYEDSDSYDKDIVISQDVPEGTIVDKYSRIKLVVSNGSNKVDLTKLKLVNVPEEDATRLLESKGLTVKREEEINEAVEKGYVIKVSPQDRVEQQGTVTLTVSLGPPVQMVKVPDISNQLEEIAIGMLEDSKLLPGENPEKEYSDTVEAGYVIRQTVLPDTEVEEGSVVGYVISEGVKPEEQKYYGSLNVLVDLKNHFGPGSSDTALQIIVRLKQDVNGETVYTTIHGPETITANTQMELKYKDIQGADGVLDGAVEVVDVNSGEIYKSYNIIFEKRAKISNEG